MKKFISIMLCAAVCLTAGCKSKNETPNTAASGNLFGSQPTSTVSSGAPARSSNADTSKVSTPAAEPSDVSSPSGENSGFVRGKWNGSIYTSDFFGFSIDLDSSWTILSDEQTAEMSGLSDMSDAVFCAAVEKSDKNSGVYELMASRTDTSESFALAYSKCDGMTLEDYIDYQVRDLSSEYKDVKADKINIAGKSVDCIYATLLGEDIEVKEAFVPYKNGDYIALIVIAAYSDSGLKSILSSTLGASVSNIPDVSDPSVENGGFVRGKWNGNVFTSDFFGFSVAISDSSTKESDSALAEMNNISDMSDANFNAAVENCNENTAVYEAFIYDQTGNISITYNRFEDASLAKYTQANANGMSASGTFKDVRVDVVNIGDKAQPCVYSTYIGGANEVKELMVMYKNGDYFAIVTLAALSDSELQKMAGDCLG